MNLDQKKSATDSQIKRIQFEVNLISALFKKRNERTLVICASVANSKIFVEYVQSAAKNNALVYQSSRHSPYIYRNNF